MVRFVLLIAFVWVLLTVAETAQAAPACVGGACSVTASADGGHGGLFRRDGDGFLARAARATGAAVIAPFRAAGRVFDGHRLRNFRENRPRLFHRCRGCE